MNSNRSSLLWRGVTGLLGLACLVVTTRTSVANLPNSSSRRLADTVAGGSMSANGSCRGTLDLLRATGSHSTISVAELNSLIADNAGALALVVDVNEANGGLETARAQGVAVLRAEVKVAGVTVGGGTANPAAGNAPFSTQTQAQIAPTGATVRQTWYTLLGDAGSNEITPRNVDGKVFDSTLRIPMAQAIPADATDVKLYVEFLKTNTSLGDPEDFYDCTGGAEDMALVTRDVGQYFDVTVPTTTAFRTEAVAVQASPEGAATLGEATAPSSSWVLMPGANTFKMVGYEDLYPSEGDYDFNDAVVGYRWGLRVNANGLVEQVSGEAYLVARGSNYTHHWTLSIPVAGLSVASSNCGTVMGNGNAVPPGRECQLTTDGTGLHWRAFDGSRTVLPPLDPASPQQNTRAGSVVPGPRATFTITLATPLPMAAFGVDDPWLYVVDTAQEIHLSTRAPGNPRPFALLVPSSFRVPLESTDLTVAYPQFATFVTSGGAQGSNWYANPSASGVVGWAVGDWAWANGF